MHISAWREYELSKQTRSENGITAQQLRWLAALAGKTPENQQEAEAQQLASTALRKLQGGGPPGTLDERTQRSTHGRTTSSDLTAGHHVSNDLRSSYAFPSSGQYSRMPAQASLTQQLHSLSGSSRLGISHVLAAPSSPSHAILDELYPQRVARALPSADSGLGAVASGNKGGAWGAAYTSSRRTRDIRSAQRNSRGAPAGSAASVASAPERLSAGIRGGSHSTRGGLGAGVPNWLKHSSFAAGATHGLQAHGRPKLRTSHAAAAARALARGGVGQAFEGGHMGIPSALHTQGGSNSSTRQHTSQMQLPRSGRNLPQKPVAGAKGGSESMLNDTQRRLQLYTGAASGSRGSSSPGSPLATAPAPAVPRAALAVPGRAASGAVPQHTGDSSPPLVGGLPLSEATALLDMMQAQAERQESLSAALQAQAAETQQLREQLAALAAHKASGSAVPVANPSILESGPVAAAGANRISPPRSPVLSTRELLGAHTGAAGAIGAASETTHGSSSQGTKLTGVDRYLSALGMGSGRHTKAPSTASAAQAEDAGTPSTASAAQAEDAGTPSTASAAQAEDAGTPSTAVEATRSVHPTKHAPPVATATAQHAFDTPQVLQQSPASPGDGEEDIDGLLGWLAELPDEA